MDASALTAHGDDRDGDFYLTALTYAHYLWQRGFAARAILKLDRALLSHLHEGEAALREWPLPYEAIGWLLRHTPDGVFIGNPRVHFQHLADRMNEPRREQRRWRTWACWAITRVVRPEFPPDTTHIVSEPTHDTIAQKLVEHGLSGEVEVWRTAMQRITLSVPGNSIPKVRGG
jgi:hypothetical protein